MNNYNYTFNYDDINSYYIYNNYLNSGHNLQSVKLIPKNKHGNKIHIKKKNRGKFTEYCGGKVTDECILKGKHSNSPTVRKRAIFADNARKWRHGDGGNITVEKYVEPYTYYEQSTKYNNSDAMRGMMKARLAIASHFGNQTARRMTNYDTRYYTFPDSIIPTDPIYRQARGNVYVGSLDNWVIPHIKDINGQLLYVGWDGYKDLNMRIETPEDALYFAEHYKEIAPMMYIQDGPFMYNK